MSKIQFILGIVLACASIGILTGCIGGGIQDAEVASAKGVLNIYLGYAAKQDQSAMWETLHPDSKNTYRDFNDFASNNGITTYEDYYYLNDWTIESADKISNWKIYSNVVACKVNLNYKFDSTLNLLDILGIAPDEQEVSTTIFLIKSNYQWMVFSENSSILSPEDTNASPNETQPESLPTTPNESDIPTISAKELISQFDYKSLVTGEEMDYLNQVIRVTGVVQSISSSIVDLTYSGSGGLEWVCCNFDSSNSGQLTKLFNGDGVIIQGTLKNESIFVPVLVDCEVVE